MELQNERPREKTIEPRPGDELPARLEDYLRRALGLKGEFRVRQFPGGYSNLTYEIAFGAQRLVLRRPPRGQKAASAHDMGREYFVLSRLHESFPLCPEPLHYCEDPEVIGAPFYIMAAIEGLILRAKLPSGFHPDPELQKEQSEAAIRLQAELHQLDYERLGLGSFGHPEGYRERQVAGWSKRYRHARTDDAPDFESVMTWLEARRPSGDPARSGIIHNDFKLDNLVFDPRQPTRIIGVLDWEMATIGDPLMDLGNSFAYWVEADDPPYMRALETLPSRLPGFLNRREQLALYQRLSGCSLDDWDFYYTAGLFRLAVIAQQIYARYRQGHSSDPRFAQLILGVRGLEAACHAVMEGRLG